MSPRSPIRLRIRAAHALLFPCLLWGTGTIGLSRTQLYSVRQLQRTVLAQMLRLRKADSETWDGFHLRRRLAIDSLIESHKVKTWHEGVASRKWGWAGHCARHCLFPMPMVMARCVQELETMRVLTSSTQGHTGDPRSFWWRWENDLESLAHSLGWSTWRDKIWERRFWLHHAAPFLAHLAPGNITGDHDALWGDALFSSDSSSGSSCVTGSSSSSTN